MTDAIDQATHRSAADAVARFIARADVLLGRFPAALVQLVLRFTVALPFWRSGLTKWDGFLELSDGAVFLFQEEFRLHILGSTYPFPFPTAVAFVAGCVEIVLPILLVLGLGTRFAALGLLVMTGVIQLTVPDGWATYHLPWAAMLLALVAYGAGKVSLDHWIGARRMKAAADRSGPA
ncbi:DoxX family protein [Chelatococcus sp. SYSU_G07232]|uniref:DoxX family protein n=1 Tax=Chelatococcus albus TaxID=3047466 RepID=A0ABT7AEY4_9HYPH|nr:DoxX family protein [Chelatococcus sp. SYSU_G07232]MDJ1157938.1 DoxX family protein [Chelatococcus sp. SYSU_G07232]